MNDNRLFTDREIFITNANYIFMLLLSPVFTMQLKKITNDQESCNR